MRLHKLLIHPERKEEKKRKENINHKKGVWGIP